MHLQWAHKGFVISVIVNMGIKKRNMHLDENLLKFTKLLTTEDTSGMGIIKVSVVFNC